MAVDAVALAALIGIVAGSYTDLTLPTISTV